MKFLLFFYDFYKKFLKIPNNKEKDFDDNINLEVQYKLILYLL